MSDGGLRQDVRVDEPGLVGARWWQDSVVDPVGRRAVITGLLAAGIGVGTLGFVASEVGTRTSRLPALDLQRKYGWSFGAAMEALVFNGATREPFDPKRLDTLLADLAPRSPSHRPYYVQTLFESVADRHEAELQGDPAPIAPLRTSLQPIFTNGMRDAFGWARAAGDALASMPGAALVVDLDGQDAVAFAAGAADRFDPVFLFDNWPHPRGVVPAHLTLASAAYYQPLFARAQHDALRDAPPMFVLDRQRLAFYSDDASRFDNRWVARLPGAGALRSMGVTRLLYVAPPGASQELDDLNDDFVSDVAAGIALTLVDPRAVDRAKLSVNYHPTARRTLFSSGLAGGGRPAPAGFGSVPVAVSMVGGTLLGVAWSRSGTWNRGWGG